MNIAVILNGISLNRKYFYKKWLPVVEKKFVIDVFETRTVNDGITLGSKLTEMYKYKVIFAAGGDGTLHQVMNGIVTGREHVNNLPFLGLVPLGSGNDFARSANISKDPTFSLRLLEKLEPTPINIGKIAYTSFSDQTKTRYFINVADIGMGPEVVKLVNESGRTFGSLVSYYKSIIRTFFTYKPMVVHVKATDWEWTGKTRSLAIANGRYYGHGLCIAPSAEIDDDVFTAFICGNVSVLDFIRYSETLKKGKFVMLPEIQYKDTTGVQLTSEELCLIEGDGEILGKLPARVELIQRKINFLK